LAVRALAPHTNLKQKHTLDEQLREYRKLDAYAMDSFFCEP